MKIPFTNYHLKAEKLQRVQINNMMSGLVTYMGNDQKTYIKDGYKMNPNVYAVINWIIKKAAISQWNLFEMVKGDKVRIQDHEILDLLNRPNPTQGKAEFIESMLGYKLLTGESFIYKLSPENGVNMGIPQELWILPPPSMSVKFNAYGMPSSYEVLSGTKATQIAGDKVIYLKYWNPSTDSFRGQSPIEAGRRVVTQSNDAYVASMKLLQNMGAQGVLSVNDDQVDMSQEQIDALEAAYMEKYGGPSAYGRILITGAKMNWQQIGLPASDLALIESQQMSMRDICNLYNISSQLFNDPENKTYANMKEARKSAIADVIIPEMELVVNEFNRWLLPSFEKRDNKDYILEMDRGIFTELKEDEQMLSTILGTSWWMTPNEKRERMGLGKMDIAEMDDIYAPTSIIPLGYDLSLQKAYESNILIKANGQTAED